MVDNYIRFEASLSQVYSPTSKVGDEHSSALKSSQDQIWSTLHERYLLPAATMASANRHLSRLFILLRLLSIYQGLLIHPKLPQTCLSNLTIALCSICMNAFIQTHDDLLERTFDALALVSNSLTIQARIKCLHTIRTEKKILEKRINFLLGPVEQEDEEVLHLMTSDSHSIDSPDYRETDSQGQSSQSLPFCLRRWELVQDAIPSTSENDASLSLSLFNGRKRIFG
ncbi:hypothetical protein MMC10_009690 [Thelotrema lepadinum]|nr:hypothetical protein [Thelotrema lepadinum]